MTKYRSYDLVDWGQPLEPRDRDLPEPGGREVLLEITAAGLCHSDLHMQKGYMDLGELGKLYFADRGAELPTTMGHEIAGRVVAMGPDAEDIRIGQSMLVFPWVGCGECLACREERDSDCMNMRIIGLKQNGGFATHVLVEDAKFLIDIEGLDPAMVVPHACSGLTVYNALLKIGELREGEWLAVLGAGGLGLNAIAIAAAMGFANIVAVDIDEGKLDAARDMGADAVLNGAREDAIEEMRKLTDNRLLAVLDTFGGESTAKLAVNALSKSGRYLVVGQHGGDFKMPQPWLPQKAMTVRGSHVGDRPQLRALIDLVRTGKVKQIPIETRPMSGINGAIHDLEEGKVTGRIVLKPETA